MYDTLRKTGTILSYFIRLKFFFFLAFLHVSQFTRNTFFVTKKGKILKRRRRLPPSTTDSDLLCATNNAKISSLYNVLPAEFKEYHIEILCFCLICISQGKKVYLTYLYSYVKYVSTNNTVLYRIHQKVHIHTQRLPCKLNFDIF